VANSDNNGSGGSGDGFTPGPASESVISLSQAILAPLDALAKAQVHAARSFLNLVLQVGYPHSPWIATEKDAKPAADEASYSQTFRIDGEDGKVIEISVPTLALVPLQPLGIESATFNLEMAIREVSHHEQMQASEQASLKREHETNKDLRSQVQGGAAPPQDARPWYLVSEPVSVRGTLSDPGDGKSAQKLASIKMDVKLSRLPTPAGLQKLLVAMTQNSSLKTIPDKPNSTEQGS